MDKNIMYVLIGLVLFSTFLFFGCTKQGAASNKSVQAYDITSDAKSFGQSANAIDSLDSDLEVPDLDLNISID